MQSLPRFPGEVSPPIADPTPTSPASTEPGLTRRAVLRVGALVPVALAAVPAAGASPVPDPHATALYETARTLYGRYTRESNQQARTCLDQALAVAPTFARGWGLVSATWRQDAISAWTTEWERSMRQADTAAGKAVTLARAEPGQPALPATLEQLGWVRVYQGRHEEALQTAQEALAHTPTYGNAYGVWALALSYLGQPLEALTLVAQQEALQRHPQFLHAYHRGHAMVSWGLTGAADHAWDRAQKYLEWALRERPDYRPARSYLTAALMALEEGPAAGQHMAQLAQMGRPSPHDRASALWFRRANPFRETAVRDQLIRLWMEAEDWRPGGGV